MWLFSRVRSPWYDSNGRPTGIAPRFRAFRASPTECGSILYTLLMGCAYCRSDSWAYGFRYLLCMEGDIGLNCGRGYRLELLGTNRMPAS